MHVITEEGSTPITREVANNVLNWFRADEGYPAGSFFETLYLAASKADALNQARLALGFPAEMAAFLIAQKQPDGLDFLRVVAAGVAA